MDEAQQNQYELRLKEVFDTFDSSNSGSLCLEELSELCQVLHLQEVEPLLLEALLTETDSKSRVHFEAFKEALIFVLSTTIEAQTFTEEDFQQQPESVEVDPKFVKDGKRYGRRSAPELGELAEGLTDKALSHGIQENSSPYTPNDCENLRALEHRSEEYEAEGQLRFWNPDDLGASRTGVSLSSDGLEEHLAEVFNELGVSCNGYASHKELVQVCERLGLETLEDSLVNVDSNGTCSVKDFICAILRNRKPPTPSASTPYRQLKRHLSTQPFDESGRRTATPSAMASTIGLRLFSSLDDGSGYTPADQVMDAWQEEGIDNSHEILQALDFNTEGKVNLSELTVALENELLITKNGIHQAVLASFKTEIRHLLERLDHEVREKEKVRNDLDKADKFKTQMATEVDEHHSALERLNDYNIRKLSVEYRERLVAVKAELTNERDVILHQASKHRQDLEKKIEGMKEEEAYLRDRLTLAFKENSRLETELLENMDKLIESENLASKLQKNLDSILGERFGDLDPSSAEFFLQEERLRKMRATYEEQCRELQDRIDELQLELEEYRTQSKVFRTPVKHSLLEEFDTKNDGINLDPGVGSEEAHPLNISLEAEMMMEQMKEHHRQDVASIQTELEGKFENKLEEIEAAHKLEVQNLERHCQEQKKENVQAQSLVKDLFAQVETLNVQLETAKQLQEQEREDLVSQVKGEISELEKQWAEKVGVAQAQISELQQQHVEEMNQSKTQILELESKHREEVAFVRADISKLEKEHAEELRLSQAHISEMEEKWEREKHAHATDRAELVKQHAVEVSQLEARITELEMCHAEEVKQSEARIAELSLDLQKMEQTYRDEMTMLEKKHMEEQARLEKLSDESQREHVAAERDKLLAELELKEEQLMKQFSGEKALLEQQHIMVLEELNSKHCEEKDKLTGILEKLEKKLHDERNNLERHFNQMIQEVEAKYLSEQHAFSESFKTEVSKLKAFHEQELQELTRLHAEEKAQWEFEKEETLQECEELQEALQKKMEQERKVLYESLVQEKDALEKCYEDRLSHVVNQNQQLLSELDALNACGQLKHEEALQLLVINEPQGLLNVEEELLTKAKEQVLTINEQQQEATEEVEQEQASPLAWLHTFDQKTNTVCSAEHESWEKQCQTTAEICTFESRIGEPQTKAPPLKKLHEERKDHKPKNFHATPEPSHYDKTEQESGVKLHEVQWNILIEDTGVATNICDGHSASSGTKLLGRDETPSVAHVDALQERIQAPEREMGTIPKLQKELKCAFHECNKCHAKVSELTVKAEEHEHQSSFFAALQLQVNSTNEENLQLKLQLSHLQRRISKLQASFEDRITTANLENQECHQEISGWIKRCEELNCKVLQLSTVQQSYEEGSLENHRLKQEHEVLKLSSQELQESMAKLEDQQANETVVRLTNENTQLYAQVIELKKQGEALKILHPQVEVADVKTQKDESFQDLNAQLCSKIQAVSELEESCAALECENTRLRSLVSDLQEKLQEQTKICSCTAEKLKAEKTSAKKMVDTLRAQLAEVRTRSEQLERENAELSFKIGQLLRHKEKRESGRRSHSHQLEEMNKGKDALIAELGSEKKQIISRLSALEVELTKVHERSVSLEQEKTRLSQELFAAKEQLAKAIQMQSELSNKSEKLSKEKEVLSEELNRCVDKVAKAASLESQLAHLKTDRQAAEQLVGILKSQLSTSQEKVHSLDEALQNSNLQMSRLKSDLRVSQQEKETLKHEVMSLHKQLQNANDKNQVLELSLHSAGYQNQHKKLYWDDLTRLVEQEQQLLRQENERLQKEMQNTKGDLQHSREKIRQLEAGVLSLKQHKQQNQSSLVKVLEQEKLALQRDLEQMHKELLAANRKLSDLSDSVQEVENLKMENENLRVMLSRMERELLETQQYFQAQHRLLQTERRGASRAQEPASMAPDLNMQQESRDAMLLRMEERMRSVEQNLHNVKLLLQEKVNQLKDQLQKNVKADEMIKDLYVENSQLLKALEMTEQRQKVTEKKNYLLEEKIASLNKIVRDLSPSPIAAMPYHFSRS
ncbi:ninein isoform X2 [Erpetoichthys calabaricus]|uniref:ninein isoform X2 n=1 Tax=Erpetoichthys calabaricus TaxID=27687 RepID=UPI002233FF2A|nr:ninein isoform X2 [Erpetoichthys calabaricus]